jgi:hypothetical protein
MPHIIFFLYPNALRGCRSHCRRQGSQNEATTISPLSVKNFGSTYFIRTHSHHIPYIKSIRREGRSFGNEPYCLCNLTRTSVIDSCLTTSIQVFHHSVALAGKGPGIFFNGCKKTLYTTLTSILPTHTKSPVHNSSEIENSMTIILLGSQ